MHMVMIYINSMETYGLWEVIYKKFGYIIYKSMLATCIFHPLILPMLTKKEIAKMSKR